MSWGKTKNDDAVTPTWNKDIEHICELAPPSPEDAIYRYLKAVYQRAMKLKKPNESQKKKLAKIANLFRAQIDVDHDLSRLIIELTALPHMTAKMKWKYARALQYARQRDVKSANLITFIKGKGGINGCVEKYKPREKS